MPSKASLRLSRTYSLESISGTFSRYTSATLHSSISAQETYADENSFLSEDLNGADDKTIGRLSRPGSLYNTFELACEKVPEPPLPDVGLRPWLAVLGGFCAQFCAFGVMNTIGLFITHYEANQLSHMSSSSISWIGSIQSGVFAFAGVICGRLNDMYGPLYLTIAGCVLLTVGFATIALCTEYYQFILAQGFCVSLGAAGLFYSTTASVSTWFAARRGIALGVAASGASIGGIVLSFLFNGMVNRVSFAAAVYAMAGVLCFFSIISVASTASRLKPTGRQPVRFFHSYIRPFYEIEFSLFTLCMFFIYLSIFVPMAFFASAALAEGLGVTVASQLIAYLNVGSFFGRIFVGVLADRINKISLFFVVTLGAGLVSCPSWYLSHTKASLTAVCVLYGFFSGGILALFATVIAGLSPVREIGTRVGTVSGTISVATLIALPIAGAITGNSAGFGGMKIYSGVFLIAGALVALGVKVKVDRKH
ncbi:major facilitator superfamily domain-containing protein [Lipomyces arxii]|uniref:major facilitator superfamily domain-containing protein n=1 Tax=Lipomyces arxii TaxID=56418 RepID=UPI0034CFD89F